MKEKIIFRFHGNFEGYPEDFQDRFVSATTESEAFEKLDQYCDEMVKKGFARFIPVGYPTVEIQDVID